MSEPSWLSDENIATVAKNPQAQQAAVSAAKNPAVQAAAVSAAKDPAIQGLRGQLQLAVEMLRTKKLRWRISILTLLS